MYSAVLLSPPWTGEQEMAYACATMVGVATTVSDVQKAGVQKPCVCYTCSAEWEASLQASSPHLKRSLLLARPFAGPSFHQEL